MKTLIALFILILIIAFIVEKKTPEKLYIKAERGDVVITPFKYEGHEYLIFRGGDYFSAVIHSESCHYCDSIKTN